MISELDICPAAAVLIRHYGIARGQAAVFYDGTRVLGGGWIADTALDGAG